jgi:Nif-specific regulatory protein
MSSSTVVNWTEPAEAHVGEVRKLSTLLEASQALASTLDLKVGLHRVLEILGVRHGAIRSSVVLTHERTGEVQLKVVSAPAGMRHAVNEQVTPVSIPISVDGKAIGVMRVDLRFKADRDYHRTTTFLGVLSSIIGQAVKVQGLIVAERQRLVDENAHLRQELKERYDFSNLIGTSGPMRQVCEQVAQVAETNTTVLLRGESGTGKELIAHAVHYNSPRAKKPFIKVSCAALPHDLMESELFGYEKGAFTDAKSLKKGRFEIANGGTLFLDEIGELSSATQIKLLRVLQERQFERLGGTETIRVNIRLIAATNKNLERAIEAGDFREDLYYRLNVFTIFVPPLGTLSAAFG